MKQLIFMIAVTAVGVFGAFASTPFVGFAVYVFYAVLRPQFMWQWSLETYGQFDWSRYVALATIAATVVFGPRAPHPGPGRCPPSPVRLAPVHVWFCLFGVWLLVSYLQAYNRSVGERYMEDYAKHFLMFAIGAVVVRTVGQAWTLFLVYALSIAYISYEVNFAYLVKGHLGIAKNGYGGYDNNGAGMFLAMGVPLCAFAWEAFGGWKRWAFAAFIPVIVHAVLMTYSRGAMLALIVASPFWIARGRYRWQKIGLGALVLACVPFLAGKEIQQRFFSVQEFQKDDSANSRMTTWKIGFDLALEHPVFGVGVRNSPLFTFARGADQEGRVIHSQYLQVAADNGFGGLLLYLAVVGTTVWNFERVIRAARGRTDPDSVRAYTMAAGFQAALITYLVGATFLSCEAFEPQYYVFLVSAQLRLAYRPPPGPPAPAYPPPYPPTGS